MRAAVLFSGIGGWEIACELNGVDVAYAAEWDEWKRARYRERWAATPLYGDVEKLDGRQLTAAHGPLDILLGSPPCTDISAANVNGCGVDGAESRYYFEAIRLARESGTRWIGFENSPRLRTRGADRVLAELEASGYTCWANVVEAEGAGAPHERGRSFVLGCRADVIAGSDADRRRLWLEQGWGGWTRGAGAAEPEGNAGNAAGVGHREAAYLHGEQRRLRAGRRDGPQVNDGLGPTPCHSDRSRLAEWQGVGIHPLEKLTSTQRAALCPWDQRGDGLAGYLSVADGLASRLRGHGLSDRAVKAELARWRSALGDALVIPVVWAVVRSIVRTDATLRPTSCLETV